jgi:hypothetical protein
MATAKKTVAAPAKKTGTAVTVKKTGGAVVSLADMEAAKKVELALMSSRLQPASGITVRASPGWITLPDGTKTDQPLSLVIVDFVTAHNFYEKGYNAKEIVPPGCFAVGTNPKEMFPSDTSPNKQYDNCQECPQNMWNSGKDGKGKACNNERMLAVMPPDADANTPIWLLKVSKGAAKGFDGYIAGLQRMQTLPYEVITTVSLLEGVDYPSFVFSDPEPNADKATHFARKAEAKELLMADKDVSGYKPVNGPATKKTARR